MLKAYRLNLIISASSFSRLVKSSGSGSQNRYTSAGPTTSTNREARFLKKLMTGSAKTRKKWYTAEQSHSKALKEFNFFAASSKKCASPINPTSGSIITGNELHKKPAGRVIRRLGVLNTVFLEHITSILSTGEIEGSEALFGMGLEITGVHVTSDFKFVNVFWYSSASEEKERYLEMALKSIGFKLRHQLTQLRVIGIVPPIQFVKDDKYAQLMKVERLLEKTKTDSDEHLEKSSASPDPHSEISSEIIEKIERLPDTEQDNKMFDEGNPPEVTPEKDPSFLWSLSPQFMRQDVLGLDRERIMRGITDSVEKRRKKNTRMPKPNDNDDELASVPPEQLAAEIQIQSTRAAAFMNYLKKQRLNEERAEKRLSTAAYERKFYESLKIERMLKSRDDRIENVEDQFYNERDVDDYLPEEDEDAKQR